MDNLRIIFDLSAINYGTGGGEQSLNVGWSSWKRRHPSIHLALFRHGFKDKRKEKEREKWKEREGRFTVRKANEGEGDGEFSRGLPIKSAAWQ